ncbi:hypothetical protein [Gemmatimonas sp.]|uniref:hypothetical protein n=1 Tax=Gemmatimonas sp. TaxID=1962908 RepID=UPI003563179D
MNLFLKAPRVGVTGLIVAVTALATPLASLAAQTDYYNTDAGRPVRIEDAYAIERRAVELQMAPFRLERVRGGAYRWGLEPELAVGLFPRTQVEIGFPLAHVEGLAGRRQTALAGIDASVLYNLNTETRLPALAIVADVLLPVGAMAPGKAYPSFKAIATKTFSSARVHVNGQVTIGDAPAVSTGSNNTAPTAQLSRWLVGVAVDRTLPLRSLLLTAELVISQPLDSTEPTAWDVAGGARYQLSPRLAVDGGGGYRLTGADGGWFLTAGAAVSLGLPWSPRR